MGFLEIIATKAYAMAAAPGGINPLPENTSFTDTIQYIINVVLLIAGILAVVYLIYSGIQYITASGDATKATAARTGIINAIIGIVVILLSYAIAGWVFNGLNTGTV